MDLVLASAELLEGNVLSFKTFPTQPYSLRFVLTFHVAGEVKGEIAYRVRKWQDVIHQTPPKPLDAQEAQGQAIFTHADSIELVLPGQGSYLLDILFGGSLLHSVPFSVFDSSNRTDLEREIIYYLKAKRGPTSVHEITRGVYNPEVLRRSNFAEMSGKVYFALLRMQEVVNTNPMDSGSLAEKLSASRWKLK